MSKVLLAITSYNKPFYADGAKTGLFAVEAIHPFEAFKAKGFEVDFVSETGTFGYDDHSLSPDFLNGDDLAIYSDKHSDYNLSINKLKAVKDINPAEYSIFFAAGGHGTVYDFPEATGLARAAEAIYNQGGVVSAVCHGPAIFSALKDKNGKPLIQGKNITGFTDEGETILGVDKILAKDNVETVADIAKRLGATFKEPPSPWEEYVVVDGRIISGVNPASAGATARSAIAAST